MSDGSFNYVNIVLFRLIRELKSHRTSSETGCWIEEHKNFVKSKFRKLRVFLGISKLNLSINDSYRYIFCILRVFSNFHALQIPFNIHRSRAGVWDILFSSYRVFF